MRKVNVTLTAQTILQLEAGTHKAVRDGGDLYVLLQQEEGFADTQEEPSSPKKATSEAPKTTNAPAPQPAKEEAVAETSNEASSENWTEDEMMNMHSDDLLAECKRLGIDPNKSEGKNTNKKLRTLLIDYWNNGSDVANDTQPAKATEKEEATSEDDQLQEISSDEWGTLKEGDMVLAKLNMDGDEGDKLWEAEVVGWKKPKGGTEEKLYVFFTEDEQEDYLRDGDKLFEWKEEL